MCFWLPVIREWMGSSLIAYYSGSRCHTQPLMFPLTG